MNTAAINQFKGFSLHPLDALKNIAKLIECGRMLSVANDENLAETGDDVIDFAIRYALAACEDNVLTPEPTPGENINLPHAPTIGERIRELRKQRGMTSDDLANVLNVSVACISAWEGGFTIPACDKAVPLAKALYCDPMWLLTGEPVEIAEEVAE